MLYVRAVGLCESSEFYNPNHPNPKSWQNKPANRIKAEGGVVWGWESFKGNDKFDNAGEVGVWEDLKGNQNGKRNKGGGWGGWRPKRRKFRV